MLVGLFAQGERFLVQLPGLVGLLVGEIERLLRFLLQRSGLGREVVGHLLILGGQCRVVDIPGTSTLVDALAEGVVSVFGGVTCINPDQSVAGVVGVAVVAVIDQVAVGVVGIVDGSGAGDGQ